MSLFCFVLFAKNTPSNPNPRIISVWRCPDIFAPKNQETAERGRSHSVIGQAIALQNGVSGQSIEVIYSGIVYADWVTEGQTITSAGVYGAGVLDGVLQVWSKDRPLGTQVEAGSYKGTGTYGPSHPNSITFSFKPKMFILYSVTRTGIPPYSAFLNPYIIGFDNYPSAFAQYYGLYDENNGSGSKSYGYLSDNTFVWYYEDGSYNQMNDSGVIYYYYAIG